jgi:deoxyribonuclease V
VSKAAANRHAWDLDSAAAAELQRRLAARVVRTDMLGPVRHVAGVDVGFEAGNTVTRAAVVVLEFPGLAVVDRAVTRRPTTFPYIPGLLSFRELPAVLEAFERLSIQPDLILCDGQGLAHPRRFGIACHLGVWLDRPTIGVAKSRLVGTHEDVPPEKGAQRPLEDRGECIGAVLRTRAGVRPLYISIGHRISLPAAVDYVLRCTTRYRLPETTRAAHTLASKTRD